MKRLSQLFENMNMVDICHCFGTGACLLVSKVAPILAVVALIYQIKVLRAKASLEEILLERECQVCKERKKKEKK